jgi:cation-transporting P-type ATPase D
MEVTKIGGVFMVTENALNSHPYEAEISALLDNPGHEFNFINESTDLEMSEMYTWVETETQLKELVDILSKERVFAVDTEQHSLRSFLGFTPLIQVHCLVFTAISRSCKSI